MRPLSDIIRISVTVHTPSFRVIAMKYREDFLKQTAQSEFDTFLKTVMVEVQKMISPEYTKRVLNTYFTEYGQILIIYDALKTMFMVKYDELSESF